MCIKKLSLLPFIAILLVACSSTPKIEAPTVVDNQVSSQKGFSLPMSEQEGWTVFEENPYKIVYTKQNIENNERYTIQALVVKLPSFDEDKEFLDYIEKSIEKNRKKSKLRVVEQEIDFISGKGEKCVRYNSKEEPLVKKEKTKSLMLGMVNFTCRHPEKQNTGIYIAYSKKSYSDKSDENLVVQAENIFSKFSFSKF